MLDVSKNCIRKWTDLNNFSFLITCSLSLWIANFLRKHLWFHVQLSSYVKTFFWFFFFNWKMKLLIVDYWKRSFISVWSSCCVYVDGLRPLLLFLSPWELKTRWWRGRLAADPCWDTCVMPVFPGKACMWWPSEALCTAGAAPPPPTRAKGSWLCTCASWSDEVTLATNAKNNLQLTKIRLQWISNWGSGLTHPEKMEALDKA